jgi:hypothetical protein
LYWKKDKKVAILTRKPPARKKAAKKTVTIKVKAQKGE